MNSPSPREIISAGARTLLAVLGPCGFTFVQGEEGKSSGGLFAQGKLVKGDRSVDFSFRHGLGEVSYNFEDKAISHENYLKYSGNWNRRKYPDFAANAGDSFAALAQDIQEFLSDFAQGPGDEFKSIVTAHEANPNKFKGFASLPRL